MRRFGALCACAAAVAGVLAAVGPASASGRADAAAATPATVTRLAPWVYLYSSDADRPDSTANFIAHSRLRWTHDGGCSDVGIADTGQVNAAMLGDGTYPTEQTASVWPFCQTSGTEYKTTDYTRPYSGLAGNEGFFLDLDNSYRHGLAVGKAPVYFQYKKYSYVTYWFFYGNNNFPIGTFGDHEGDWEAVSIKLNGTDNPVRVAYDEHDSYCTLSWTQAPKKSGRLLTYSANGSHADYPTAGTHVDIQVGPIRINDHTDKGPLWNTAMKMDDVYSLPWYGYGGGWGEVGDQTYSTGPLGPSLYKSAEPSDWLANPCS